MKHPTIVDEMMNACSLAGTGMYFVGREREIKQINANLASHQNIIIHGKYGIGRTSLVRHVAALNKEKWRFVFLDFALTPEQVCRQLYTRFFTDSNIRKQPVRYKKMRQHIARYLANKHEKWIVVLDNIEKITHQRIDFLRFLSLNSGLSFIGIAEHSLPKQDVLRLRAVLQLICQIHLSYLPAPDVKKALIYYSDKYSLGLSEQQISSYKQSIRGYPLFLTETIVRLKSTSATL